jgi:hypothetical protein
MYGRTHISNRAEGGETDRQAWHRLFGLRARVHSRCAATHHTVSRTTHTSQTPDTLACTTRYSTLLTWRQISSRMLTPPQSAPGNSPLTNMSSSQPSTALAKRSASSALMPPPPAPKRIKRPTVVLDEDTYTSAVSHIIRRDFFPGLEETDAQREYLNALDSKDNGWIKEAGKRLTQVMTPLPMGQRRKKHAVGGNGGATPVGRGISETPKIWGNDTPLSVAGTEATEDEEEKRPEVDLNLSLGAFQAKYTS